MSAILPLELVTLLEPADAEAQARAWDQLITSRTRLLLAVARSFGGSHDETMDRYAFILEKLREGDFRRLRTFRPDRGASFDTWLSVASRRLCLDHHRSRFGRPASHGDADDPDGTTAVRRALAALIASDLDVETIVDSNAPSVERASVIAERDGALAAALDTLPSADKILLALRYRDDLSASRIATVLGFPTQFHVYRRIDRALAHLRQLLERRGIESSDG